MPNKARHRYLVPRNRRTRKVRADVLPHEDTRAAVNHRIPAIRQKVARCAECAARGAPATLSGVGDSSLPSYAWRFVCTRQAH